MLTVVFSGIFLGRRTQPYVVATDASVWNDMCSENRHIPTYTQTHTHTHTHTYLCTFTHMYVPFVYTYPHVHADVYVMYFTREDVPMFVPTDNHTCLHVLLQVMLGITTTDRVTP